MRVEVEVAEGAFGARVEDDSPVSVADLSFEEARAELEKIVGELESGRAGLDDAVRLWERGEALYRHCVGKLDAAEGKIEELGRRAEAVKPEA